MTVFSLRLKESRKRMGLTQEKLGIAAGMDELSASARMNQYETGKHTPDYATAGRLAKVLDIPVEYFYCDDDAMAEWVLLYHHMNAKERTRALKLVAELIAPK